MKSTFKHLPRIEEILPGALTLGLLTGAYQTCHPDFIKEHVVSDSVRLLAASGLALLGAWIVGACLDAIRDILEEFFNIWFPLNLDYFLNAELTKVQQFDEYYFAYYSLDFNFAIGIAVVLSIELLNTPLLGRWPGWGLWILLGVFAIFAADAYFLRKNMRKLIGTGKTMPHVNSYTRLRPSKKERGVGVFAIRDIPKGTNIFRDDPANMIPIDRDVISDIEPERKELYDDFCVITPEKYLSPKSFNCLTVSWYVNEPNADDPKESPNVRCTGHPDYHFIAIKDIKRDDELLVDYSTYSEYPSK